MRAFRYTFYYKTFLRASYKSSSSISRDLVESFFNVRLLAIALHGLENFKDSTTASESCNINRANPPPHRIDFSISIGN